MSASEGRLLRNRQQDLEADIGRQLADLPPANPARVIKLYAKLSFPTSASRVFACKTQKLTCVGGEVEGATVTTTDDSGIYYAVNIGSKLPAVGSLWVATPCQGYWLFGQNA